MSAPIETVRLTPGIGAEVRGLAVTGGIAAYKVPELVRALTGAGHSVRCVMTSAARRFVAPLVL